MNTLSKLFALAVVSALLFAACGGNKNQQEVQAPADGDEPQVWQSNDSTIYGLCGEASAMNTLQLITDNGDTLELSTLDAKDQNRVFGGYSVGDRMAVLADRDRTTATLVINETALLGNWVMPNPIDGSDETGISIREGGVAESIDQSTIVYRTWRIMNGLLEIVSIREGGGDVEETNLYEIISLGNDSLVYKSVGRPLEEEETFEYSRQRDKKVNNKVKLEESSFDDFKM